MQSKERIFIHVRKFIEDVQSPMAVVSSPNDPDILYISEQRGYIWKYDRRTREFFKWLDISQYIPKLKDDYDERGIMDMVLHPDFANPKSEFSETFYIFYSIQKKYYTPSKAVVYDSGEVKDDFYNCLSSFSKMREDGTVDLGSETIILSIQRNLDYHNGGKLLFGPDRYLYLAIGDGGPQKDPYNKAQNLKTWFGKVLRINVSIRESDRNYSIPLDNPFVKSQDALPEIYAYGFRNPWGMGFDMRGRLFVSDVGYDDMEELDIVVTGGNYGWNKKEGTLITPWTNPSQVPRDVIDPIYTYKTPDPIGAIIGGYPFEQYGKNYWIGADISGQVFLLQETKNGWERVSSKKLSGDRYIKTFCKDGEDTIYIVVADKLGPIKDNAEIQIVSIEKF